MNAAEYDKLKWTAHPLLEEVMPTLDWPAVQRLLAVPGGDEKFIRYYQVREETIARAQADGLRHGFDLPHWKDMRHLWNQKMELYALGANGSAKTEFGAKLMAELLAGRPGARVLCIAQNEDASKLFQQSALYKYLPVSAREWNTRAQKRRSSIVKVNYSQAGGFTEGTFVLPNKAQCLFKTVEQYERNPGSFEGPEYDGVWIDEGAPLGLVDTLMFRLGKRAGKFLFTYTAVHGMDAVCARVLEGARVLRTLPMRWRWRMQEAAGSRTDMSPMGVAGYEDERITFPELKLDEVQVKGCPPGHMPYIMQPLNFQQGVIFTWTHWNPFLPLGKWNAVCPDVFDRCVGRGRQQTRVRLFGWVEKISGCRIPNFRPEVHVLRHEVIEQKLKAGELTIYMSCDPATARSYYMLWKGVDRQGRQYILHESPGYDEGEWVGTNGEAGDGQKLYAGMGVKWYKAHIRDIERKLGATAVRRKGDPRAFATQAAAAEGGTSLFELFRQDHEERGEAGGERGGGNDDYAPMYFEPAKIRQTIDLDLEKITSLLAYDVERPVTVENEPRLYVSDRCQNLIRCWLNWDGKPDSPHKDPVDAGRYLFDEETPFIDESVPQVVGGRGW